VQKTIQCQGEWEKSVCWFDSITHPVEIVTQAKNIVRRLSWNELLNFPGTTSLNLTGFLGTSWLSDTQIDMMVDILQEWMKTEKHTEGTTIEPLTFSQEITLVARGIKEPTSKYLLKLTDQIHMMNVGTLWFPIRVRNSHWVTGRVDLERHAFAFGK
jgi:hypothetical protein